MHKIRGISTLVLPYIFLFPLKHEHDYRIRNEDTGALSWLREQIQKMLDTKFTELEVETKKFTLEAIAETLGKNHGSGMGDNDRINGDKVKEENFVELGETTAREQQLSRRLKEVERTLQKIDGSTVDIHGLYPYPSIRLPPDFKFPDTDIYDGTGCPRTHIRMYVGYLKPLGINDGLLVQLFQRSLTGTALKWLMKTDPSLVSNWQDMVDMFVRRFMLVPEIQFTRKHLEAVRQEPNEALTKFFPRWRTKSLEIDEILTEQEMVDIIVNCLNHEYWNRLISSYHPTLHSLWKAGSQIQNALDTGRMIRLTNPENSNGNNNGGTTFMDENQVNTMTVVSVIAVPGGPHQGQSQNWNQGRYGRPQRNFAEEKHPLTYHKKEPEVDFVLAENETNLADSIYKKETAVNRPVHISELFTDQVQTVNSFKSTTNRPVVLSELMADYYGVEQPKNVPNSNGFPAEHVHISDLLPKQNAPVRHVHIS